MKIAGWLRVLSTVVGQGTQSSRLRSADPPREVLVLLCSILSTSPRSQHVFIFIPSGRQQLVDRLLSDCRAGLTHTHLGPLTVSPRACQIWCLPPHAGLRCDQSHAAHSTGSTGQVE